jgi:DNA-binding NtrC family response regulator
MDTHRSNGGTPTDPGLHALFAALRRQASANGDPLTLRAWLERAEAWRILDALREASGNRSAAARALGIGRRTLYTKMEKLGIQPAWGVGGAANGEPVAAAGAAAPERR